MRNHEVLCFEIYRKILLLLKKKIVVPLTIFILNIFFKTTSSIKRYTKLLSKRIKNKQNITSAVMQ